MSVIRFHPGETLVLNFVIPFSIYDVKAVAVSFRDANSVVFESLVENACRFYHDAGRVSAIQREV